MILKIVFGFLWNKIQTIFNFIFQDLTHFLSVLCVVLIVVLTLSFDKIDSLNTKIDKLSLENSTLTQTITDTTKKYETVLSIERSSCDNYKHTVQELSKLANVVNKKPTLVEKLVNKGSADRNRCFALATGDTPGVLEKNNVCPHIVKGVKK